MAAGDEDPLPIRLVAGLGHVHGGAKDLTLTQPKCGNRVLYRSGIAELRFARAAALLALLR